MLRGREGWYILSDFSSLWISDLSLGKHHTQRLQNKDIEKFNTSRTSFIENSSGLGFLTSPCKQSLSKTDLRTRKTGLGSAEMVSSLLSCCSPSFWAGHPRQTGLGSLRIIFLSRQKSKWSLQYKKQYGARCAIKT